MEPSKASLSSDALLEHSTWIRQLALGLVHDPGAADDLIQETWMAFFRARPDTDRPLRPWLSRVLRNAASRRSLRRAGRTAREEQVARAESLPSSLELVLRAEQQTRLVQSVLALEDPYRSTVLLRYFEGLTPMEIAEARGIPAATVRTHLHRGLEQLRQSLDEEHGGDRKAWVLMLQPLLPRSEVVVGVGVGTAGVALLIGAAGLLLAVLGPWDFGASGAREALDGAREPFVVEAPTEPPSLAALEDSTRRAAASAVAAQRTLQLVDRASTVPLADYELLVEGSTLRTDAQGMFLVDTAVRSFLPVDDARQGLEIPVSHNTRRWTAAERTAIPITGADVIALDSGPTMHLTLTPSVAANLEGLQARWIVGERAQSSAIAVASLRRTTGVSPGAWVRFAPIDQRAQDLEAQERLEVRDSTGYWSGAADLLGSPPGVPERVAIELQSRAVLSGFVVAEGVENLGEVTIALRSLDATERAVLSCAVDADGRFDLRWVLPGRYELMAQSALAGIYRGELELHGGETLERDIALVPVLSAGAISGVVHSESGTYAGQLLLFLGDEHGENVGVYPTTWRAAPDGRLVAPFTFEQVPHGSLTLDLVSLANAVTFCSDADNLQAPNESVQLLVLDSLPAADWDFDVRDADSGEGLAEFDVTVSIAGGPPRTFRARRSPQAQDGPRPRTWELHAAGMRWNHFEHRAPLRGLPLDTRLTWTVSADGYLPASGAAKQFQDSSAGERSVRVNLIRQDSE